MRTTILIIVLLSLLIVVNQLSFEDEVKDEQHYCQMVEEGHWPDYKNTFTNSCQ